MNPLKPLDQLPLVLRTDGVFYQAESGAEWPIAGLDWALSSISDEHAWGILQRMVAAYNGTLGHVHNTDDCDPDGHVVFTSVCCGSQLYRCAATADGLPSKPMILQGEQACRVCGTELAAF